MPTSRRILLCRLGVLFFCALPTAAVVSWVIIQSCIGNIAASKEEWERELTSRLGLHVEIGAVTYHERAIASLSHVRLLDPETKALIAAARMIEIGAEPAGWAVDASQLEVEASQLGALHRSLYDRVLRSPNRSHKASASVIRFVPRDITLSRPGQPETLRQCAGQLTTSETVTNLELEFQIGESSLATAPVSLTASRNRNHSPPQTTWQLETNGAPLPCRLLAEIWPPVTRLGTDCAFAGSVQIVSTTTVSGQLSGTFQSVDLDALISEQFPHQLSGLATLHIDQARLVGCKLMELQGNLQAPSGAIGHSLLAAAEQHLGLRAASDLAASPQSSVVPFHQLAISFRLDGKSLSLAGLADPSQEGVMITHSARPILTAPPQHQVPAAALLRTLVPENQHQVPATRQTAALVGLFPVPDVLPSSAASATSHTPTRLSPATPPPQSAIRQPVLR